MTAATREIVPATAARLNKGIPAQAVILCGGMGTRLGNLTRDCPKPLLPVAGSPFLDLLIDDLVRQGAQDILLLAANLAEQVEDFAARTNRRLAAGTTDPEVPRVRVTRETRPAGTSGALWQARALLAPRFLLLNGDSWFDILLADLTRLHQGHPGCLGALALRRAPDGSRFGCVDLVGSRLRAFSDRGSPGREAIINGGVYCFSDAIADHLLPEGSLEQEVLPRLARAGKLAGSVFDDAFLDIGVPEDYARAQSFVPAHRRRPAIVFDRDGVLNLDHGHVGTPERFTWMPTAREAVRRVNAAGWFAFVATNQAGIGKGRYTQDDYLALRRHIYADLAEIGAHIDDERFCATHPNAVLPALAGESSRRKPGPGMLEELRDRWPVDWAASVMIGDRQSDMEAARAADLSGRLFDGATSDKSLLEHVDEILARY